jgi:dCMP deaminase
MRRLSFPEMGVLIGLAAAFRSEDPKTRVGAVGFNERNEIVGVAYNGFKAGMELTKEFLDDRELKNLYVMHAETNLLSRAKKGEIKTLFLTHSCCKNCAVNVAAHDVKEVVYLQEYHREQSFRAIFDFYGIKYSQIDKSQIDSIINTVAQMGETLKKLL